MEVTTSKIQQETSKSSIRPNAFNVELAKYEAKDSSEREDRRGWVNYGADNLYPQYLIDRFLGSPVHNAICNGIAEMIAGKGLTSTIGNIKLDKWKANNQLLNICADLKIQGGFFLEVILTKDKKEIAEVNHLPFENCRVSIDEETDEIDGVWYSKDWNDTRKRKYQPTFIEMLPAYKPMGEIDEIPSRFVVFNFRQMIGSKYYPRPDYIGAMHYIEISEQIGMFHLNNIMNGFFPSIIAQFNNGQPDPEKAHAVVRDMERNLSGAKNAGKMVVLFNDDKDNAATFETFPLTDADKQYELVQNTAKEMIFVGHRVTSPLMFGIRDGSGLGNNANELTESLDMFMEKVIIPYRDMIVEVYDLLLQWDGVNDAVTFALDIELSQKKKSELKVCCSKHNEDKLTEELEKKVIEYCKEKAEEIDLNEWELVDEQAAHDEVESELSALEAWEKGQVSMSFGSYANGDKKSKEGDIGLYKVRYAYSQNLSEDSREFCKEMVALSKAGKVFRFEDIKKMSDKGVNGSFAPQGQTTYDIFTWKGGVYCHHFFKRQIYFRKREGGKFLPNDGLKNDKRVGNNPYVKQKGQEAIAPINTPTRGSLKNFR